MEGGHTDDMGIFQLDDFGGFNDLFGSAGEGDKNHGVIFADKAGKGIRKVIIINKKAVQSQRK